MMAPKEMVMLGAVLAVAMAAAGVTGQDDEAAKKEMVPAMFVFGDSLIDNGNNNNLPSFAKANYFPYGIDFQAGPTGRFSNGFTIVDQIAKELGLPLLPAYSEASPEQMMHGVNYASAASGILDITGRNFITRIPFNQQIGNFESTLDQITDNLGADGVAGAIAKCLFFVGMGSNDYLNNYLMPNYDTRNHYNSQQYASLLTQQYRQDLLRLYNLGARKFVIAGLGLMGCIPTYLARSPTSQCSAPVNQLVVPFNTNVKSMLDGLNRDLPGARFIYIDTEKMFTDILNRPDVYGFKDTKRGCCGIGRNRGQITCLPFQTPCTNRDEYVFWDAFHPTEKVNVIMGSMAFSGGRDIVRPMNIMQLASLDLDELNHKNE